VYGKPGGWLLMAACTAEQLVLVGRQHMHASECASNACRQAAMVRVGVDGCTTSAETGGMQALQASISNGVELLGAVGVFGLSWCAVDVWSSCICTTTVAVGRQGVHQLGCAGRV
jgi:hypothetical protein